MFASAIQSRPHERIFEEEIEVLVGQQIFEQVSEQALQRFMHLLVVATSDGKNIPDQYRAQTSLEAFRTLIGSGNTIMLTVRGRVAATASQQLWGKTADDRTVFSIGKVVSMPEFAGRGLARRAMNITTDLIHANDTAAVIRVRTKDSAIKRICSSALWRVIGAAEDYALWERGRKEGLPSPDWFDRTGRQWMTFLSNSIHQDSHSL